MCIELGICKIISENDSNSGGSDPSGLIRKAISNTISKAKQEVKKKETNTRRSINDIYKKQQQQQASNEIRSQQTLSHFKSENKAEENPQNLSNSLNVLYHAAEIMERRSPIKRSNNEMIKSSEMEQNSVKKHIK